jgi:general secretion pathway protein D
LRLRKSIGFLPFSAPASNSGPVRAGRMRRFALAALAALAIGTAAAAAEDRVTLNFVNSEIDAVVRAIAQFTGKTFIVDPRVKGTLNLTLEQSLTPDQAMATLTAALRLQGVSMVESGGIVRVVPEADAKLQGGAVQTGRSGGGARGDELVTQVFRLNYESATTLVQVLRPLIAPSNVINAYAATNTIVVTDYAENVRRIARIIATIDTPAGSEVDIVQLKHAIAGDLAVLLGKMLDATSPGGDASQKVVVFAEPGSNSLLIRAASPGRIGLVRSLIAKLDQPSATPGNINVVHLKNAEATRLARTLLGVGDPSAGQSPAGMGPAGMTSGAAAGQQAGQRPAGLSPTPLQPTSPSAAVSGQIGTAHIQADPTTNTLIITAPEAVYRQLRVVIDKLDVRRAQVFIESLIVEVTSGQAAEFGIQWLGGLQAAAGSQTTAVGGTFFGGAGQNILGAAQNLGSLGNGLNIGVVRGQVTLPGIGTVSNLPFLARALEQNSNANILSTPNILTLDNEEARIVVGQNVPFITGQFVSPASAGGASVNPFQTIERHDVGLTLRVRPQISEGGTIKMVIYQEVSSVDTTQINTAGIITNLRSIDTNVLVDDGAIVVLGGLVQDTVNNSVEKVPLLGDIPLIGNLFRYDTRKRQKTNLMVFLRPYVVRDEATASGLTLDRYDSIRSLEGQTGPRSHWLLPDIPPPMMPPADSAAPPAPVLPGAPAAPAAPARAEPPR